MSRGARWAYMGRPTHNPPSDKCPVCTEPSKVHFIGSKTVSLPDGTPVVQHRYRCEHGHTWVVLEP